MVGWHKRRSGKYFYRSKRDGNTLKKVYIGGGPLGEFAARAERLRLHEKQQDQLDWERQKQCIEEAVSASQELDSGCELMQNAALLTAGFHRADRRPWRPWRNGRRILKQLD